MRRARSTRRSATTFNEGTLKGLTLLLQGNNLTNEPAITRQSPKIGGSVVHRACCPGNDDNYGRVIMLGASYKF